jgi:hypothetical protein
LVADDFYIDVIQDVGYLITETVSQTPSTDPGSFAGEGVGSISLAGQTHWFDGIIKSNSFGELDETDVVDDFLTVVVFMNFDFGADNVHLSVFSLEGFVGSKSDMSLSSSVTTMSCSEDVVFGNEGTSAVPPFAVAVNLEESLIRDGVWGGLLSADDSGMGFDFDFTNRLFEQIAVVQFGRLRNGISTGGVPCGTKCANMCTVLLIHPNTIKVNHRGSASVKVITMCLDLVKIYGNRPRKLLNIISLNSDTIIRVDTLIFSPNRVLNTL